MITVILKRLSGILMFVAYALLFGAVVHGALWLVDAEAKTEIPFQMVAMSGAIVAAFTTYERIYKQVDRDPYKLKDEYKRKQLEDRKRKLN